MEENSKARQLLEEMRNCGNLPAVSENVRDICSIASRSDTSSADLAAVIMRDCGLTSNILSTSNSIIYSPAYPIKTVTAAVTFMGFEKVRALALGMSLFKQTMTSVRNQNLSNLYASSYFSGLFAMELAREANYTNPEEIFVAGLLYRLPWVALANTFPERYLQMEKLMRKNNLSYDQACAKIFEVSYKDICRGLTDVYNLPDKVEEVLNCDQQSSSLVSIVHESGHIANMLFADRMGGADAMKAVNSRVNNLLHSKDFSVANFIRESCKKDLNINRYFKLDKDDVEMMVTALKWGKGNPAHITSKFDFDDAVDTPDAPREDPEMMVGRFLTELMMGCRNGKDINHILMLAQETLYRCLTPVEVFTGFFNSQRTAINGKFHVGSNALVKAQDFSIYLNKTDSPIVESVLQKKTGEWSFDSGKALHVPYVKRYLNLRKAIFAPIVVSDQVIGIYFLAREENENFSDREKAWLEQTVDYVGRAFENSNKYKHEAHKTLEG